ncbi:MAG: hypothetical protein ACR2RF_04805 [Geminicoccaceae bacterium]
MGYDEAAFPEINVTHKVDLSKFHAPRFDSALEKGGDEDVPDVIQFQTLHDYDYYAERGLLMAYKPMVIGCMPVMTTRSRWK